jgi:hypothetical protein
VTHIPFPQNATFTAFGENNAFAVLLPDKTTLVQSQPLYRCKPDTPILALRQYLVSKTPLLGAPLSLVCKTRSIAKTGSGQTEKGKSKRTVVYKRRRVLVLFLMIGRETHRHTDQHQH